MIMKRNLSITHWIIILKIKAKKWMLDFLRIPPFRPAKPPTRHIAGCRFSCKKLIQLVIFHSKPPDCLRREDGWPAKLTVLIYGHMMFNPQTLDEWNSPPEPQQWISMFLRFIRYEGQIWASVSALQPSSGPPNCRLISNIFLKARNWVPSLEPLKTEQSPVVILS